MERVRDEKPNQEEVVMIERKVWEGRRVRRQRALRMRGVLEREERMRDKDRAPLKCLPM